MSGHQERGIPATAILIGAAAAAVFIAAGYVALSGKKDDAEARPEVSSATAPSASVRVKDLVPQSPYNLSARYKDARARAELWDPKASLVRITAISIDGSLANGLNFEFGKPVLRLLGPVEKSRKIISYSGDEATEQTTVTPAPGYAMPDPNCPLESAILALRSTQGGLSGQLGILYDYSEKHSRPIWSFTRSEGAPISIDAETCNLLLR